MKSLLGTVVSLTGDVANLLDDFVADSDNWADTQLAISSRTDVPEWATELLNKFRLPAAGRSLEEIITGPWEIRGD